MKKLQALFLMLLLCAATTAFADGADATRKVYAGIKSGETELSGSVYSDYRAVLSIPASNSKISIAGATLFAQMSDVKGLGITSARSFERVISTGYEDYNVEFDKSEFFGNMYAFDQATVNVKVVKGYHKQKFTYSLNGTKVNGETQTITATPSSADAASATWQLLMQGVTASTSSVDDSRIGFKAGTWVQMGDERIYFDTDLKMFEGAGASSSIFEDALDAVHMEKVDLGITPIFKGNDIDTLETLKKAISDSYIVKIYLPAGSTVQVGNSVATLNTACFITIDGRKAAVGAENPLNDVFSDLRAELDGANKKTTALNWALATMDRVFGIMNNKTVDVTIVYDEPTKISAGVRSGETEIAAKVYPDYVATLSLPAPNTTINVSGATIYAQMSGVSGLGVSGTRSFEKTISTGVSANANLEFDASGYFENLYKFEGTTINVKVVADEKEQEFGYDVVGNWEDGVCREIIATPTNSSDASLAWQQIIKSVATSTSATEDSKIVFKKGSYVQMGDERIVFDKDLRLFDGAWTTTSIFDDALDAVHIQKTNLSTEEASETYWIRLYLAEGTCLGVSNTTVSLDGPCVITIDGVDAAGNVGANPLVGVFTDLRAQLTGNNKKVTAAQWMIGTFDQLMGLVNNQTINVTIFMGDDFDTNIDGHLEDNDVPALVDLILENSEVTSSTHNASSAHAVSSGDAVHTIGDLVRMIDVLNKKSQK